LRAHPRRLARHAHSRDRFGGAGKPEHFVRVLTEGCADAALAASIFHYGTYTVNDSSERRSRPRGIPVRKTA
jgi:imidazole glycerol-phosphate synthase subunit HisF